MSKIICLNQNCPYRSKKPLRTWRVGDKKAYSCKLPVTVIRGIFDSDGEVYNYLGYVPMECVQYADHKLKELKDKESEENE